MNGLNNSGHQIKRPLRPKTNPRRNTIDLNCTMNTMDFTDSCRNWQLKTAGCIFFSGAHGNFLQKDHILCHKASIRGYLKKIHRFLSECNGIKVEILSQKNLQKVLKHCSWSVQSLEINKQSLKNLRRKFIS